jgi:hypothetical protein
LNLEDWDFDRNNPGFPELLAQFSNLMGCASYQDAAAGE